MTYTSCMACGYTDHSEKFLLRSRVPTDKNPSETYSICPEPKCLSEKLDFDPLPAYEK